MIIIVVTTQGLQPATHEIKKIAKTNDSYCLSTHCLGNYLQGPWNSLICTNIVAKEKYRRAGRGLILLSLLLFSTEYLFWYKDNIYQSIYFEYSPAKKQTEHPSQKACV